MNTLSSRLHAIRATELRTVVEYQSHPSQDFTQVTIYGPTEEAVQSEIKRAVRFAELEGRNNFLFKGPRRTLAGYGAIGEIKE
jgi:hypothetical protein